MAIAKTRTAKKPVIQSTREQVFEGVKGMIMDNEYTPGEILQIDRLSEEFGVSSTPIREALIRLEGFGLVTLIPNKGARVSEITEADVHHIWEMRMVLEPYAARITATIEGLDNELLGLRDLYRRILEGKYDLQMYMDGDLRLHELMYEYLENPFLRETVERVRQLSMRMRYFPEGVDKIKESTITSVTNEHLAIVDALLAHDPDRSADAVRIHIERRRERTLSAMENGSAGDESRE